MPRLREWLWGVLLALALPVWSGAGEMHWCPGNRFTDALTAAEAKARGCRPASSGRLSQVSPLAMPAVEAEGVVATGTTDAQAAASAAKPPPGAAGSATSDGSGGSGGSVANAGSATSAHPAAPVAAVPHPAAPVAAVPISAPVSAAVAPAASAAPARAAPVAPAAGPAQSARDRDARLILEAELNRTLVAQQSLVSPAGVADPTRLHRLRQDEAALRREIARLAP